MPTRAPALPAEQRRAAIIAATLPLLLERGTNISTRQIAAAAGIAEGTIFAVFEDKDAVVQAALKEALDSQPTERELAAIDRSLPFDDQLVEAVRIMQERFHTIWPLLSSIGEAEKPRTPPTDYAALREICMAGSKQLCVDPVSAARQLRALTLAMSHPMIYAGRPLTPRAIVALFLDGTRTGSRQRAKRGGRA